MQTLRRAAKAVLSPEFRLRLRYLYLDIEPLLYSGSAVECPCCGAVFRRFLPHGRPKRPDARCGRCQSLERHRLLFLYLRDRTRLFHAPMQVLHFAPEAIMQRILRGQPDLRYITVDLDLPGVSAHIDITKLAFRERSFDAVLCLHVLEHIPDDRLAMQEIFRVLKPGGWAILQVPLDSTRAETFEDPDITAPADRRRHFGQEDHVRVYGRDYRDRLEHAGFEVLVDNFAAALPEATRLRHGIVAEDIYLCRKPREGRFSAPAPARENDAA